VAFSLLPGIYGGPEGRPSQTFPCDYSVPHRALRTFPRDCSVPQPPRERSHATVLFPIAPRERLSPIVNVPSRLAFLRRP